MPYTGPENRNDLTADEELRRTALKAAVDTVGLGADPDDVEQAAQKFYDFLSGD